MRNKKDIWQWLQNPDFGLVWNNFTIKACRLCCVVWKPPKIHKTYSTAQKYTEHSCCRLQLSSITPIVRQLTHKSVFMVEAWPQKFSTDVFSKIFVKSEVSHTGKGLWEVFYIPAWQLLKTRHTREIGKRSHPWQEGNVLICFSPCKALRWELHWDSGVV